MPDRNELWGLVAEATHRAVCEGTGTDGAGKCLIYSAFGSVLGARVFPTQPLPQVGELHLQVDPANDPTLYCSFFAGRPDMRPGEFHAWLCLPDAEVGRLEVVDLSSRHYPYLVEKLANPGGPKLHWRRPAPPPFMRFVPEDGQPWPDNSVVLRVSPRCTTETFPTIRELFCYNERLLSEHGARLAEEVAKRRTAP